jgi:HAD superfamily hydrolase (TIGR01450 family)
MVDGLSSPLILDNYDTFLLDMWGVMHDGRAPYEGVLRAVRKLKESGKRLIVLSNSSKRREDAERMLVELGFDPADFHDIVTSGDVSHRLLRGDAGGGVAGCENWDAIDDVIAERGAAGRRKNVFVFGSGDDDGGYCESAGWTPSSVEDADLLLARGTFTIDDGSGTVIHKGDNEALYWEVMERSMMVASRRKLPMLVSNPDKVRPDAGSKTPMPGAIGDAYERFVWTTNCNPVGDMTEEGARSYVRRIGKPFGEVYDIALSSVSSSMSSSSSSSSDDDDEDGPRRDRVIMIGDALETDVVGGDNAGIDVLWVVNDGIHGADVRADGMGGVDGALGRFNRNNEHTYAYGRVVAPRYATDHFRW